MKDQLINPPSFYDFLSPRYWPTWLGLGLMRGIVSLPHKLRLLFGRGLGLLLGSVLIRRRQVIKANLDLCFPELPPKARKQLFWRHWQALGMGMVETAMSWWMDDEALRNLVEVTGLEHLENALMEKRGVILLTGHCTTLELAAHALAVYCPFHAMYRPLRNRLADSVVLRARLSRSPRVYTSQDTRAMVRSLREGAAVWYAMDQDQGRQHAVFVPFFGIPTATITTTTRLARMSDSAVVPYWPQRLANGRYRIKILPKLADFPGEQEQDTWRINALLEDLIRETPEQYLWAHRRFKTRPPGSPSLYPR